MNTSFLFIFSGLGVFLISTFLSSLEINPFYKFYYIFAWYSYIFFVDGIVYNIKRDSLIISRSSDFIFMLFTSAGVWFIFEIANVFLKNWQYIMIPWDRFERYAGYFISYATVFPALFETSELIESTEIFKNSKIKIIDIHDKFVKKLIILGIFIFLLSIIIPNIFFPLIWTAFILIFDPLNYINGNESFIKDLKSGYGYKIYTLFTAGIICGILWELLNYKAGAKWIYNLPYLNTPKIFEMPIAGYLGFGFFALECYAIYIYIFNIKRKYKPSIFYPIFILSIIIVSVIASILIDKYTVKYFSII